MREIDKIVEPGEKIIWEGKPQALPFFMGSLVVALFGLPFLLVGLFVGGVGLIHAAVGFILTIGTPTYTLLVHRYTHYALTQKRAIFQTGLIGRDFQFVDYDQVTNAEVNVGVADKLFGNNSGSILISSAGTFTQGKHGPVARPYHMRNISNPYEVFKQFKELSHAVKTDINFPNQFRPAENPGYTTEYKPPEQK